MPHTATERNPFMLMINPEMVIAAMEKSERLGRLNRHICRPLDRPLGGGAEAADAAEAGGTADDEEVLGIALASVDAESPAQD